MIPRSSHLIHAALALTVLVPVVEGAGQSPETPRALMARADEALLEGRVGEAVATFNRLVALSPDQMPYLWQRGIALFFDGKFDACRQQFEAHRLVNPDDVENAAWHFLCVARGSSFAEARAALLPVGPDRRSPMAEVYRMFEGAIPPEAVVEAGEGSPSGRFYAALYVGLFYDVRGDRVRARQHLAAAARETYARVGGYMHRVAVVHLGRMDR